MRVFRLVVLAGLLVVPAAAWGQDDVITRARRMAAGSQRAEAIALLRTHLQGQSADDDARLILGIILSWEGQYDEARAELSGVLARRPADLDARAALMNVELWSKRPAEANLLAVGGLAAAPNDERFMLGRRSAMAQLDLARPWEASIGFNYDRFSDDRVSWRETQVSLKRATPIGPVIARASRAERFSLTDQQFEIEMYPSFRRGTYAYLSAGMGPDRILYPKYRYAADVYQALGSGFEVAVGFRRLGFNVRADIYQLTLNKYIGNWLATVKGFYVPNRTGKQSRSYHGSFRRYFGADGTNYLGLRYSRGLARDEVRNVSDFEVLASDTVGVELNAIVNRRLVLQLSGATSNQQRISQGALRQHSGSVSLGWRF